MITQREMIDPRQAAIWTDKTGRDWIDIKAGWGTASITPESAKRLRDDLTMCLDELKAKWARRGR